MMRHCVGIWGSLKNANYLTYLTIVMGWTHSALITKFWSKRIQMIMILIALFERFMIFTLGAFMASKCYPFQKSLKRRYMHLIFLLVYISAIFLDPYIMGYTLYFSFLVNTEIMCFYVVGFGLMKLLSKVFIKQP